MNVLIAMLIAAACAAPLGAEETGETKTAVKPYPFTFCIISGEELHPDAEPYAAVYEGQQYRFCCKDCWQEFREDPAPSVKKLKKLLEKAAESSAADESPRE